MGLITRRSTGYGYGSYAVDGSRVALQTSDAWRPQSFGPVTSAVPTSTPGVPPGLVAPSMASGLYGASPELTSGMVDEVEGYGTAENNGMAATIAAANPWHFRDSPLLPAIAFLLLGLIGLRLIHWRAT